MVCRERFRDGRRAIGRAGLVAALWLLASPSPLRATGEGVYLPLPPEKNEVHLLKNAAAMEDLFVRRGYRYEDDGLEAMLARVGAALAPKPTDDYIRYRFHVLRDVDPNAFALPDGQVYVNTGILVLLENEAQLAAILAHEVHHAAGHHGILSYRSARRTLIASMALGPLTLGVGDYFLIGSIYGYSRDLEAEADRLGVRRLVRAGYDPNEMIAMLEILGEDPEGERPAARSTKWSTHPELRARAETIRDLVAVDYPRSALALATPFVAGAPSDPEAHYALAEARRSLGARSGPGGEEELTDREKRRNLRVRYYLTRDERQERLLETEEGKAGLRANMQAARTSCLRALSLDPGLAEAHRGPGFALEALGRLEEAGRQLVAYLRARPEAPDRPLVVAELKEINAKLEQGGSNR